MQDAWAAKNRLLELGRREGTDFAYVELDEEGHGSHDPGQQARLHGLVLDYLARTLIGGAG